jgi:hypothetical protein
MGDTDPAREPPTQGNAAGAKAGAFPVFPPGTRGPEGPGEVLFTIAMNGAKGRNTAYGS